MIANLTDALIVINEQANTNKFLLEQLTKVSHNFQKQISNHECICKNNNYMKALENIYAFISDNGLNNLQNHILELKNLLEQLHKYSNLNFVNEDRLIDENIDPHGNQITELFDSDPNCKHDIQSQSGGGVKCTKCNGWFCY